MQVNEKLYVNATSFWELLENSLLYDITQATGKKVRATQIKAGYSYRKKLKSKMKSKGDVKVTITTFETLHQYQATFAGAQGINTITYTIEAFNDQQIGVTYKEDFEGYNGKKNANFKLISLFYNARAKKKAVALLRSMEQSIQAQQQ